MGQEKVDKIRDALKKAGLDELADEDLESVAGGACGVGCKSGCLTCAPGGTSASLSE